MTSEAWWFGFRVASAFFVGMGISRLVDREGERRGWSESKRRWILYSPVAVLLGVLWFFS
jgi:hypothetical protein